MSEGASSTGKRPTNVNVRRDLIDDARAAGVNLSALLERALIEELAHRKRLRWRSDHLQAVLAYNDHLLRNGAYRATRRNRRSL
jgi:antitoxin CcdA